MAMPGYLKGLSQPRRPANITRVAHVDSDPSQLDELKDQLARDKHCLAAAELELVELHDARTRIEEQIAHTERSVKDWTFRVDNAWRAVRRRIDAETDSPLEADVVKARCLKILGPIADV